jgi:cell surface protein SprA
MSDTVGVYTNYLNAGPIAQQLLIKVMNLDRLNANNESHSDGKFDYVEGYTVQSSSGRIIFPVVEPFGSHLAEQLGSQALAEKYCYQELYDSTLTVAEQVAEKNKFRLKGEYTASLGSEIDLGAMNVARGSVKVTAGGATLVENTDYTVDYTMGIVTILNESIMRAVRP